MSPIGERLCATYKNGYRADHRSNRSTKNDAIKCQSYQYGDPENTTASMGITRNYGFVKKKNEPSVCIDRLVGVWFADLTEM